MTGPQSIQEAGVYEVHNRKDLSTGRKARNPRWVFIVKLNTDGTQMYGIDMSRNMIDSSPYGGLTI